MEELQVSDLPELEDALLIAAFSGWNDSAGAASWAVKFLVNHWDAVERAHIDPEGFYDFTQSRPRVRVSAGVIRQFTWPKPRFYVHRAPRESGQIVGRDCVMLLGDEPQRRWKAFCGLVMQMCQRSHVRDLVLLGALSAEVPHTLPVQVAGVAHQGSMIRRMREHHVVPATYEGPTGVLTALHEVARKQGIATTSLWGTVPYYVSAVPNLPVAEALLRRMEALYSLDLGLNELSRAAGRFNQRVDALVLADNDVSAYVRELEHRANDTHEHETGGRFNILDTSPRLSATHPDLPSPQEAVEDVEALLRRFREQSGSE